MTDSPTDALTFILDDKNTGVNLALFIGCQQLPPQSNPIPPAHNAYFFPAGHQDSAEAPTNCAPASEIAKYFAEINLSANGLRDTCPSADDVRDSGNRPPAFLRETGRRETSS